MKLFRRKKELTAELKKSQEEVQQVKEKTPVINKLSADLQGHLKENHFGPRLYAQLIQDWK